MKGAGAVGLAGLAAGCLGGGGGQQTASPTPDTGTPTDDEVLQAAYDEGVVREASATSLQDQYFIDFEKEYDAKITHHLYRGAGGKILTRLIQEHNANNITFDFYAHGGPQETLKLYDEGILKKNPTTFGAADDWDYVFDDTIFSRSFGLQLVFLYNTNIVDQKPESLDELVSEYAGQYTVDVRDDFLMAGMEDIYGKDEADDIAQKLGSEAVWKESHYTAAKQVAAGEFAMCLTYKKFAEYDFGDTLGVLTIDEIPRILRESHNAIIDGGPHPNAAAVYQDWNLRNSYKYYNDQVGYQAYVPPSQAEEMDAWLWTVEKASNFDTEALNDRWRDATGLKSV